MSETVLKFLLSELKTFRLRCQNKRCTAIVEFTLGNMDHVVTGYECPVCKERFRADEDKAKWGNEGPPDYLAMLAEALRGLAHDSPRVKVEFVLDETPEPDQAKGKAK